MDNPRNDLLNDALALPVSQKRKLLIPLWIKIFSWIFLVIGLIAPVGLVFGILGYGFQLSLYGYETDEPLSVLGLLIITVFFLKGLVSFGILKTKDWAIKLALVDAIAGIVLCSFAMIYPLLSAEYGFNLNFRLELFLLIPYLVKLLGIRVRWENV